MKARGGTGTRRGRDPRVRIIGERVKLVLSVRGYSEKQAARELAERGLAKITQPALNNICTGKTVTCRQSVRDGLAQLGGGVGITAEWLGGEKLDDGGLPREDRAAIRASSLRHLALVFAIRRAWERDFPTEKFPSDKFIKLALRLLDPISWLLLLKREARKQGPPVLGLLSPDERDAYTAAMSEAIRILLRPWLENGPANWQALDQLAGWIELTLMKAEHQRVSAQMRAELDEAVALVAQMQRREDGVNSIAKAPSSSGSSETRATHKSGGV